LGQVGLPPFDIFSARSEKETVNYLIAGDAGLVLGPLESDFAKGAVNRG
jgi:hypothetical protein